MKNILLVGSHGLNGNYGGWDQLVNNIVKFKSTKYQLNIISPSENKTNSLFSDVKIIHSSLSGFGLTGLLLDIFSIIRYQKNIDCFLLLGAKGVISALLLKLFLKKRVIVNVGGIEWERPQYSYFVKLYLKACFHLSVKFADACILDNLHYKNFLLKNDKNNKNIYVIPYGGEISYELSGCKKYSFLNESYFLSISRSISDNKIYELCKVFEEEPEFKLVLISNLSKTSYGKKILSKFSDTKNIILIDGLYNKNELDLIRRLCSAYIHTHTLCGSAPSLIEMIVCNRPIISIDVPQNRFTLDNEGIFFKDFNDLKKILKSELNNIDTCSQNLICSYDWKQIIKKYEELMNL